MEVPGRRLLLPMHHLVIFFGAAFGGAFVGQPVPIIAQRKAVRNWADISVPAEARKPRASALGSGQLEGIPEEVSGWNGSESNYERISVSFSRI